MGGCLSKLDFFPHSQVISKQFKVVTLMEKTGFTGTDPTALKCFCLCERQGAVSSSCSAVSSCQ